MLSTGWERHHVPDVCTGTIGVVNKTAAQGAGNTKDSLATAIRSERDCNG